MELVLEMVSRTGRTLERQRVRGDRITIGRSFDNDFVLSDETVNPHHAVLEVTDESIVLSDLASLNGTRHRGELVVGPSSVASGDEIMCGRARVRIYALSHPVADTARIDGIDGFVNRLGDRSTLIGVIAIVAAVTVTELWLNAFKGIKWEEIAIGLFAVLTASGFVAGAFAILGRITKHESRFQTLLSVVFIYLLAQTVIVFGYEWLLFNTLHKHFSVMVGLACSYALLCVALWVALQIATHLSSAERWRYAIGIATIFLGVSLYPEAANFSEFSKSPEFVKTLQAPVFRVADGVETKRYLRDSQHVYTSVRSQRD